MELTVIKWLFNSLLGLLAKIVEVSFRVILLLLPLGVFLLVIQSRSKLSSTTSLSVYTKDESVWQHVYPGFMLVSVNKNDLRDFLKLLNNSFQQNVEKYKYTLAFIAAASTVALLILMYIKY